MTATADAFRIKQGQWVQEAEDVCAILLDDGNFLFYWDMVTSYGSTLRKMILTVENGTQIKFGRVNLPISNWMDTSTWQTSSFPFKLENFVKVKGKCIDLTLQL